MFQSPLDRIIIGLPATGDGIMGGFGSAEAGICGLDMAGVGADTAGGEGIMVVAFIMAAAGFGVATGDSEAVSGNGRQG